MGGDYKALTFKEVNTLPVAHMVAQIRSKQLSIKDIQNKLLNIIKEKLTDDTMNDRSLDEVYKLIVEGLQRDLSTSNIINNFLQNASLDDVQYEIKTNKTSEHLNMALEYVQSQGEKFIPSLLKNKLNHCLSNDISPDELPTLQSPSHSIFWGNENPPVSTAMLISIVETLNIKPDHMNMPAAATVYSFPNKNFEFPNDLVPENYPFASRRSVLLIDAYQYGGQRDWSPENYSDLHGDNQLLLGPEDCSSAVGKSTYCTTEQVNRLDTKIITQAYYDQGNEYHYRPVTCVRGNATDQQLKLIQPGNIYVNESHTAIVACNPDQKGKIVTLQFNRQVDLNIENKSSGGGLYAYDLGTNYKETGIYFLKKELPWKESSSLIGFLKRIEEKYKKLFPNGPVDTLGDCRIFYE